MQDSPGSHRTRRILLRGGTMTLARRCSFILLLALAAWMPLAHGDETKAPAAGTAAPDFTLTSNEGKPTSLADFRGKWVVLYFYPKNFTSGCTLEAKNFQSDLAKYEQANAAIVGVSVDTAESHKDFCAKEGLSFKLLSDPDAKVSTQYGSVMEYNGNQLSARNTFLINPDGRIARVFLGVKPAGHSEEVLSSLKQLQSQ
jgi:thioredoxin-dependent peroxiredoxin